MKHPSGVNTTLGDRIAALRRASGLSQSELSDRLGISRSSYQYYERNERELPSPLLARLCELFDDDAHRLLTGAPSPPIVWRIMEVSGLVEEIEEDMDVELTSEARWRVIFKVLRDDFRLMPGAASSNDREGIVELVRMLA